VTALRLFPDPSPTELAVAACPSDPMDVLATLQAVLPWALVYRGGTYHLTTCRDSHVNTRTYGCSKKCTRMQGVFVWLNTTLERRPAAEGRARRGA
jgi:hypothetical protein